MDIKAKRIIGKSNCSDIFMHGTRSGTPKCGASRAFAFLP
jgi:hypothetical protein